MQWTSKMFLYSKLEKRPTKTNVTLYFKVQKALAALMKFEKVIKEANVCVP